MGERRRPAASGRMGKTRYRVWLVAGVGPPPRYARYLPPTATAIRPAEDGVLSAPQAARYVEAFNRAALARGLGTWAIAVPVAVRYEGDLRAGESVAASAMRGSVFSMPRRRVARGGRSRRNAAK